MPRNQEPNGISAPKRWQRDAQKSEAWHQSFFSFYLFFFLAVLDLSCSTQNLTCGHAGSFLVGHERLSSCDMCAPEHAGLVVVALRLSWPMACGILLPQAGVEPTPPALEGGILTTAALGKSLGYPLLNIRPHSGITWRTEAHSWSIYSLINTAFFWLYSSLF